MNSQFVAEAKPGEDLCTSLVQIDPCNPFCTLEYLNAELGDHDETWLLGLSSADSSIVAGCFGFVTEGRLNKHLAIHSLPKLQAPEIFWQGLHEFCKSKKVTEVSIGTFGSPESKIPELTPVYSRRRRQEFILDLDSTELSKKMSSNHRRNIKKAQKANLNFSQNSDTNALERHVALIGQSMQRRKNRGENVVTDASVKPFKKFLAHGAGGLYQVSRNGEVLSSLLALNAQKGAYYHSAGSHPQGMASGSSHFLISSLAKQLQTDGITYFNLGGVDDPDGGLARFKSGFGANPVNLETATFHFSSRLHRAITASVRLLRR